MATITVLVTADRGGGRTGTPSDPALRQPAFDCVEYRVEKRACRDLKFDDDNTPPGPPPNKKKRSQALSMGSGFRVEHVTRGT